MEDHLFGDKEKFVTAAYKKKLQEDQQWLAEEKVREAKEAEYDVVKTGHMGNFYRWGWLVWLSSGLAWIWACRGLYSRRRHVEHLKGWVVSESPVRLCVAGRVQGKDAEQDIELGTWAGSGSLLAMPSCCQACLWVTESTGCRHR